MTAKTSNFDESYFRSALGRFPSGVTVITTEDPATNSPVGLTISSFSSVSLTPPMVLWTLSQRASSLMSFKNTERYVVHILAAPQLHLAQRFASGPQPDRFAGQRLTRTPDGTLKLDEPDCAAWFECYNHSHHQAGDHIIFVGQVERCHRSLVQPLVYHAGDFDLTPSHEPLTDG